jgi:hypothetical protein
MTVQDSQNEASFVGVKSEGKHGRATTFEDLLLVGAHAREIEALRRNQREQEKAKVCDLARVKLARLCTGERLPVPGSLRRIGRAPVGSPRVSEVIAVARVAHRAAHAKSTMGVAAHRERGLQDIVRSRAKRQGHDSQPVRRKFRRRVGGQLLADLRRRQREGRTGEMAKIAVIGLLLELDDRLGVHGDGSTRQHLDAKVDHARGIGNGVFFEEFHIAHGEIGTRSVIPS